MSLYVRYSLDDGSEILIESVSSEYGAIRSGVGAKIEDAKLSSAQRWTLLGYRRYKSAKSYMMFRQMKLKLNLDLKLQEKLEIVYLLLARLAWKQIMVLL